MAITVSGAGTSTGVGAVITTSAFTSVTGSYYLFAVALSTFGTTITSTPTATNGITFTQLGNVTRASASGPIYLYGGQCTSGSSGTISTNLSGSSSYYCGIDGVVGASSSGTVVQTVTALSFSVTLAALSQSTNATYAFAQDGSVTPTVKAGWTSLSSTLRFLTEYNPVGDTAASFGGTSPTTPGIIAIELALAAPAAFGTTASKNSILQMGCGL